MAFVHTMLPVTKIVIRCAASDIQKVKNPDVQDAEYQQDDQMGFWNVRGRVLFRDGQKCFHCGKTDVPLNVHHPEGRKTGGNSPSDLITLCGRCHKKSHSLE